MRTGTRAASGTLVVHLSPTVQASSVARPARVGFVVGRAVGGSVVRHRVVRQLRHLTADLLTDLAPGTDVVVRALPPAARAAPAELDEDLRSALRRAASRSGHASRTVPAVSP